jgi:hypothetical protein
MASAAASSLEDRVYSRRLQVVVGQPIRSRTATQRTRELRRFDEFRRAFATVVAAAGINAALGAASVETFSGHQVHVAHADGAPLDAVYREMHRRGFPMEVTRSTFDDTLLVYYFDQMPASLRVLFARAPLLAFVGDLFASPLFAAVCALIAAFIFWWHEHVHAHAAHRFSAVPYGLLPAASDLYRSLFS